MLVTIQPGITNINIYNGEKTTKRKTMPNGVLPLGTDDVKYLISFTN